MAANANFVVQIKTPDGDTAMDDANDAVRVNVVAGSAGGTEYTEGDTDSTITGTAFLWEDTSDTLRAISAAKPLPIDVLSLISGTGATNLGKAINTPVGATDTGIAMLVKHAAAEARLSTSELDYDIPRLSDFGAILTEPEQHFVIDDMNNLLGFGGTWAGIDSDTTGVASSTKHVLGTASVEFDKVDGLANSGIGGITKALTAVNLGGLSPHDIIQTIVQVGATTELDGGSAFFFIRLGTNSTDYNEWRIDGTEFTAGIWETVAFEIGDASFVGQGGDGADFSAITYVAVGFSFDAVGDELANIYVDEISFHTNQHVNAAINAELTSSVSSANINVHKVGGSPTTKGAGNVGNGTQRITLATDDINMAAIKTAVEDTLTVKQVSGASSSVEVNNTVAVTETTPLTGFATSAKQLADGHNVTVDNPSLEVKQVSGAVTSVQVVTVRDLTTTAYVSLSTGTETTLLAGTASTFHDLKYIMGANHSDAAVTIDVRTGTAGAIVQSLTIPAEATQGVSLTDPMPQVEVQQAWTVDMPDITGTVVDISALFRNES